MNHKLYHLLLRKCALSRVTTLSYEDWLYRKADQYAHNEILAFLMMILGMISLVGGLSITVAVSGQLLLIPMIDQYPLSSSSSVGLVLTTAGFIVLLGGFVSTVHYDRKRTWHVGQIEKAHQLKNRKIDIHIMKEALENFDKEARARIRKTPENPNFMVSSQKTLKKRRKTPINNAEKAYPEGVGE
jgi:hypothetical protein